MLESGKTLAMLPRMQYFTLLVQRSAYGKLWKASWQSFLTV